MINNNMKSIFMKNRIKSQYLRIKKKIFLDKKLEIYYLNKIKAVK